MVPQTLRGGVRRFATFMAVLTTAATLPLVSACDKVPLLAPAGAVITIFQGSPTVASNGSVEIVATVIERGGTSSGTGTGATTSAGGTPVHNGTLVSFTTTIGRIEPREARTHNGEVRVMFFADGATGTALITAYSGGASATNKDTPLLVGSAAAERIVLTTTSSGGATQVVARVETTAGTPLAGVPVTFSTTSGSVSPTSAVTDANGEARTTLTSGSTAKVKATAGAKSAEVEINRSGLAVKATPTTPNVGQPVTFEVTTAAGQAATNVRIDYGDGGSRNLGTVSGTRSDTYTYTRTGNFQVSVTADNAENAGTAVSVGTPDITLAAAPSPTQLGNPTTFTATVPTGTQVERYTFTYSDGTVRSGTSRIDSHVFPSRGTHSGRVEVFGVGGVLLGSASASVVVQ